MAKPPNVRARGPAAPSAVSIRHHEGPLPTPEDLQRYEALTPGTAERIIRMAEDESGHRRRIEDRANVANVEAQAAQLAIADYQSRAVFRSDMLGQVAGLLVSLACIAGAVYLALSGREWVAGVLAAIPTAAVIQAFFVKRPPRQG